MATPTKRQQTIPLGVGLLHAEFFRADGVALLARVVTAAGSGFYLDIAPTAVHSIVTSFHGSRWVRP